jgi:death-on-curing family protein
VGVIARNYRIDPDELLVTLWDYSNKEKFDYVDNDKSVIKTKHFALVKRIILSKFVSRKEALNETQNKTVKLIVRDYDFSSVGKLSERISHITRGEVLTIYEELRADFDSLEDPIQPAGVKDNELLESALFHPQTSYERINKYPTVESAAAALMYSLSSNHAFHNGNKRTAMVAMLVLLDRHHISLVCDEDELFKISVKLADHSLVEEAFRYPDAEVFALARWIYGKSKVVVRGDRVITLKRLRRILNKFDARILDNGHVERNVLAKGILGSKKMKILVSKKAISDTIAEGGEVDIGLIKSLRADLELDSEHAIDSEVFYQDAEFTSSEFIIRYQNLLRRLARL